MNRIKYKVLTIATAPLLVVAVILSGSHISNRMDDAEAQLVNKARNMAKLLATFAEYGIVSGNDTYTMKMFSDVIKNTNIISATIKDQDGNNLYYITNSPRNQRNNSGNTINIVTNIARTTESIDDYETHPIYTRETIGTLVLKVSTASLQHEKRDIIIEGIIITILLLIITVIGTLIYIKRITNPFNLLLEGIDKIRKGNLGYQLATSPIKELDILSRHINKMSLALKEANEKLQEQSENELHIERNKAAVTLEAIGEGVISTDTKGIITYMNPAAEMLTGAKLENMRGEAIHKILRIRENDSADITDYPIEQVLDAKETVSHESHLIMIKPDNSELVIKDIASPVFNKSGELIGMVLVFYDFSNIKRMSDKLSYQASHDDLTDLYNRREFEKQLDDALKDASQRNTEHALCYLDLDQFKIINDTCGHMAGDILLKQISHQIKTRVRRHDHLARLGGDEFGIIFYDTPIKEAKKFAETIKNSVSGYKYIWNDSTFEVGVSIGLVPINANVRSHSELMMRADSACYIAKDNGRNCIHTYAASDVDFIRRNDELHWYNKINEALDNDRFTLYCQKIMPTRQSNKKGVHYEILLRMEDVDRQISPAEFISAAERYLLMPKIDRWVLDNFLKIFENKAIEGFGGDTYNINLSGQSLCNDEFLDFAMQRLQGKYISPFRLTFEITETAAISNMDKALQFILHLKELGCKFALDDFGTGVSSFQYLHDLPIDYLKIDGKFVRNIDNNRINRSIIDSISKIGHELGLEIIAEYVEDDQIRDKLMKCDVDYLQGYAIGCPTPLKELLGESPRKISQS